MPSAIRFPYELLSTVVTKESPDTFMVLKMGSVICHVPEIEILVITYKLNVYIILNRG